MNLQELCSRAAGFHQRGDLAEAERLYLQVLAADPASFHACHLLGVLRSQQGRLGESLALIGEALKTNPDSVPALLNFGNVLRQMGRFDDALRTYDRALTLRQDALAFFNRGAVLQDMDRLDDALASYDRALALSPSYFEAWNNRGNILKAQKRLTEALASLARAREIRPQDPEILNNLGGVLQKLKRFDESLDCFNQALAANPDHKKTLYNLGTALFESGRTQQGLAAFMRHAELAHGNPGSAPLPGPPHKQRHDRELGDYLAGRGNSKAARAGRFHLEDGSRLGIAAVNPLNAAEVARAWAGNRPQIVVIDDFLTAEALEKLRRFCWGSTVWRRSYEDGYLGAMPEHGFACPLLGQIAEEMRGAFPSIFENHPLLYLWGFKYDSTLSGTAIHADWAAVNVNFWITPDEANLDPEHGGLVVWDVSAPKDWDFSKFNGDPEAISAFLSQSGAKPVTIPYRANRAVVFDSDLFHQTDKFTFRDGYLNRRINITMLYGWR